ncbi:HipA domain-containing protein, partial [Gordonibacter pamelaeae]|nr:HipA domain-containing protein [Gordonibacter pamelaeae]
QIRSGALHRLPFVSAMTLIGAAGPEAHAAYAAIVTAMRRDFYSAEATRSDIRELYQRMVFNALCNNSDDHLRNHGFLHLADQNGR